MKLFKTTEIGPIAEICQQSYRSVYRVKFCLKIVQTRINWPQQQMDHDIVFRILNASLSVGLPVFLAH